MEIHKIAAKGKSIKVKSGTTQMASNDFGIDLTIDNSLSRFVNDKFILEHAKKVDKKFAQK